MVQIYQVADVGPLASHGELLLDYPGPVDRLGVSLSLKISDFKEITPSFILPVIDLCFWG